jgi:hypothetical protein
MITVQSALLSEIIGEGICHMNGFIHLSESTNYDFSTILT